jgi:hypothetical protein
MHKDLHYTKCLTNGAQENCLKNKFKKQYLLLSTFILLKKLECLPVTYISALD